MAEIKIGGRLHSEATGNVVAGANEILDDNLNKKQDVINDEVNQHLNAPGSGLEDRVSTLEDELSFQGEIEVENTPAGVVTGSGKVTTANAVRGAMTLNGDGIFDISAYNASGDPLTPAKYATLALALAAVPDDAKKGGTSIKFVQSSDNKYVQYRYMMSDATDVSDFTNTDNWSFCGDDVLVENPEYIKAECDAAGHLLFWIKSDGSIDWAVGVPKPVKYYVDSCIAEIRNGNEGTGLDGLNKIISFLDGFSTSNTLSALLNNKVNKVEGKSLIGEDVAERMYFDINDKFIYAEIDEGGNILGGRKTDGTKVENLPIETPTTIIKSAKDPEWMFVEMDKDEKILGGRKIDGTRVENTDVIYPNGIPNQIKDYVNEKTSESASLQISADAYNQIAVDKCNSQQNFYFNTYSITAGKITLRYTISEYIAKIAMFGDPHVGLGYSESVKWDNWENCIEQSFKWASDKYPYFGLAMGDQLSSMNDAINNKGIKELNDYYNRIRPFNYPLFCLAGNHDDAVPEFVHNGVIEIANVRIICFCATLEIITYPDQSNDPVGNVTDSTYAWLAEEVEKSYNAGYITILACHYCLYQTPGYWSQGWNGYINDHRNDIISLCSTYNVRLFLSAHNHHSGLLHQIVVDSNDIPLDMTNVQFGMGGLVYSEFIIKSDGFYFTEHEVSTLDHIDGDVRYYELSDDHVTHTLFVPMTNQASGTIYA